MQPVLITDHFKDLYGFLGALMNAKLDLDEQTIPVSSLIVWSQGESSALLDDYSKLEVVEKYASKLELKIILSAAANHQLRQWAQQIGWQVLWDFPGLENSVKEGPDYAENNSISKIAS